MNDYPLITVLMPVYNGEKYLRLAINSILEQTFTDFEFLIINDGSTDRSEEIILSYDDSRIRYIKNEQNLKLIRTLNKGIELAKGKYIARMDCDDISLPCRFEKQIREFQANPHLDMVVGLAIDLYPQNLIKRSIRYIPLDCDAFRFASLFEISFCHPCMMIKSEVLKKNPFLLDDSALHIEDQEIGYRLSSLGYKIRVMNDFLIYYRKNEAGICYTYRDEQKERSFLLAKKGLQSIGYSLEQDFYIILTDKIGIDCLDKLKTARMHLSELVNTYCNKVQYVDKKSRCDITTWKNIREFSFLVSGLKEISCLNKIIVLFLMLSKLKYLKNSGFRRALNIWFWDWSPFAIPKYLELEHEKAPIVV